VAKLTSFTSTRGSPSPPIILVNNYRMEFRKCTEADSPE
jgi:hypothetical protein